MAKLTINLDSLSLFYFIGTTYEVPMEEGPVVHFAGFGGITRVPSTGKTSVDFFTDPEVREVRHAPEYERMISESGFKDAKRIRVDGYRPGSAVVNELHVLMVAEEVTPTEWYHAVAEAVKIPSLQGFVWGVSNG